MPDDLGIDVWIARRLLQKKHLLDACDSLEPSTIQKLYLDVRLQATYHSNAIEGNTLSLFETGRVLEYGIMTDRHTPREYQEVINHANAFAALPTLVASPITAETIQRLHFLLMDKIDPYAGQLRETQVIMQDSDFTPPAAKYVPFYIEQWIQWLTSDVAQGHDVLTRAAIAHHDFETIHPYTAGNGKVGRLLLSLMLMQDGFPPALILKEWRLQYIQALRQAYFREYTPLINLIGRAVEHTLDLYRRHVWRSSHANSEIQTPCPEGVSRLLQNKIG